MSVSRNNRLNFSIPVTALFLFSLTLLSPKSVGGYEASRLLSKDDYNDEQLRKMVLGSRPPGCVNKCMNCRPCEATLVIPPHDKMMVMRTTRDDFYQRSSSRRDDDSYYLLSWKCRCGNKLYQP